MSDTTPSNQVAFCPKCGAKNLQMFKFCQGCGQALPWAKVESEPPAPMPKPTTSAAPPVPISENTIPAQQTGKREVWPLVVTGGALLLFVAMAALSTMVSETKSTHAVEETVAVATPAPAQFSAPKPDDTKQREENKKRMEAERMAQKKREAKSAKMSRPVVEAPPPESESASSVKTVTKSYRPPGDEPDWIELVTYAQMSVQDKTRIKVDIPLSEEDWVIEKTGLRYVLTCRNMEMEGRFHNIIAKIEFDNDSFKTYTLYQLKVNGINIP